MTAFTHGYFRHQDLELHYVEAGSGPLVIFYHGFPLFWFSFHHQMRALAKHYHVVAIDGPGADKRRIHLDWMCEQNVVMVSSKSAKTSS